MSTISFACATCAHRYQVAGSLAGKRARCKSCGTEMQIPGVASPVPAPAPVGARPGGPSFGVPAREAVATPDVISFVCMACLREYRVDAAMAGRRVRCKSCGSEVAIPGAGPLSAADPGPSDDIYGLDEPAPLPPRRAAADEDDGEEAPRRAASPAKRKKRRRIRVNEDGNDPIKKLFYYGVGALVMGVAFRGMLFFGLVWRSRGDRIAGRQGDPVFQRYFGLGAMAVGALMILGAILWGAARFLRDRELPGHPVAVGLAVVLGGLAAFWGLGFALVDYHAGGPPIPDQPGFGMLRERGRDVGWPPSLAAPRVLRT